MNTRYSPPPKKLLKTWNLHLWGFQSLNVTFCFKPSPVAHPARQLEGVICRSWPWAGQEQRRPKWTTRRDSWTVETRPSAPGQRLSSWLLDTWHSDTSHLLTDKNISTSIVDYRLQLKNRLFQNWPRVTGCVMGQRLLTHDTSVFRLKLYCHSCVIYTISEFQLQQIYGK